MRNIILLGLTSLLTDISSEMVYPLVPFFLTAALGASPAMLGLIEGLAESVASVLKVFAGFISDRIGKRKGLIIAGYGAAALGKLLLALAAGWGMVLTARVVDRLGKGIRTAPRDALIADSAHEDKRGRAFGLHRTLDTWGAVAGVGLGYWFFTRMPGEYARVFLVALLPAVLGVLVLLAVREPKHGRLRVAPPRLSWNMLPRRLQLFLVITLLFTLGNSSNAFLLLRAQSLGFTAAAAILLYGAYNASYALSSYPVGLVSDRIGRKTLLVAGYSFYGVVYLGFALLDAASHAWITWALFALYGLYSGFTDGVEKALVSDLAPRELRATAIGLHGTLVGIGLFPASFIAGQLWTWLGPESTFYFGSGMGFLASLGLLLVL
ncbi:MAG TPA: MFS transporter [Methylomirabilota bacterium]|nr:MFS transporter [Methylomirabilota bacterium]